MERRRDAHLPFQAIESIDGYTTESVTHRQCDETYGYLPSHRASSSFGRYQFILLGEQRHMCVKNLPRVATWSGQYSNLQHVGCKFDALTTTPPRYLGLP